MYKCVYIYIEFAGCPSGLGVNEVTHDEGDLQIFVDLFFYVSTHQRVRIFREYICIYIYK